MVTKREKQRMAIVELYKTGKRNVEIEKLTGYSKQMIQKAIKRYRELGITSDRSRSGRPPSAVTPENVNKVRSRVKRNPERSMNKMAKELKISRERLQFIVHKKLKLKCHKIARAHFLNDVMKARRVARAKKIKRLVAGNRLNNVLFTDEKIFTVQRAHNRQNDRQLLKQVAQKFAAAKIRFCIHFPSSVMVWGGICASGKTPLVFIDRNIKINAEGYQEKILKGVLKPWVAQNFAGCQFVLQQDWAPAHKAHESRQSTLQLCQTSFPGFWGKDVSPSNSPGLNRLDYSVWSILEQKLAKLNIQ